MHPSILRTEIKRVLFVDWQRVDVGPENDYRSGCCAVDFCDDARLCDAGTNAINADRIQLRGDARRSLNLPEREFGVPV